MKPIPTQAGSSGSSSRCSLRVDPLGADAHDEVARAGRRRGASCTPIRRSRSIAARDEHASRTSRAGRRRGSSRRGRGRRAAGSGCRAGIEASIRRPASRSCRRGSAGSRATRPCAASGPAACGRARRAPRRGRSARPRRAPWRASMHGVEDGAAAAPRLGADRPEDDRGDDPAAPDGDAVERDREPDAEDDRPERADRRPRRSATGKRRPAATTCSGRSVRRITTIATQKTIMRRDERERAQQVESEQPVVQLHRPDDIERGGRFRAVAISAPRATGDSLPP